MDMQFGFSNRHSGESFAILGTEYAHLAERRKHVFALIREFQLAVARPSGLKEAIRILHAIVPCSAAYFAIVESLLDKLTAAGAAPHRDEHRQMLAEIRETLDRCSVLGAKPKAAELVHALDALVAHEAAIRFRESGDPSCPCP